MVVISRELDLVSHILRLQASHVPSIENDVTEILKTFFERSPDCMFQVAVSESGSFTYEAVNPAGLRVAGLTIDEMKGRTPEEVLGPIKGKEMTEGLREACRTGTTFRYEPTWKVLTGTVIYDAGYMPIFDENGIVKSLFGIARNITDQRRLEAVNYQSAKMDALGKLASGVAHDFNNLLAQQQACFRLLEKHVGNDNMRMLVAEGMRSVERGKSLTDQLVTFARQKPITLKRINLNTAVRNIAPMIKRTMAAGVNTEIELADDLRDFYGDASQIEVALLNLAVNARDAMRSSGTLKVSTRNLTLTEDYRELEPGDYVVLEVEDNGSGIPADILDNILEPFFTTKAPGEGTGLGLSLVHGMARQFDGDIHIKSSLGVGTTICLYFPCVPAID